MEGVDERKLPGTATGGLCADESLVEIVASGMSISSVYTFVPTLTSHQDSQGSNDTLLQPHEDPRMTGEGTTSQDRPRETLACGNQGFPTRLGCAGTSVAVFASFPGTRPLLARFPSP